jgi:uncharacterized protein DUF4232
MKRRAMWPAVLAAALMVGCKAGRVRPVPVSPSATSAAAKAMRSPTSTPNAATPPAVAGVATALPQAPVTGSPPTSPRAAPVVPSTAVPTALPGTPHAGVAPCHAAQLELSLGPNDYSPGTMQRPMGLTLRNRSAEPCFLFGYPRLVRVDAAGKEVPWDIKYGGDQMVTPHPPRPVELPPGAAAYVTLNHNACQRYVDEPVTILFFPPGETQPIQHGPAVPWTVTSICRLDDPGARESVSPIGASIADTIAHP